MKNFITNHATTNLKTRLIELVTKSDELKFLVGFFYFSGIMELYEGLKEKPDINIKVLVGLNVDKTNFGLIEFADKDHHLSDEEDVTNFCNQQENHLIQRILIHRSFMSRSDILSISSVMIG